MKPFDKGYRDAADASRSFDPEAYKSRARRNNPYTKGTREYGLYISGLETVIYSTPGQRIVEYVYADSEW
jgi:hypothetical protein